MAYIATWNGLANMNQIFETFEEAEAYTKKGGHPENYTIKPFPRLEKITYEIFAAEMAELAKREDPQDGHVIMDLLMCELLLQLGYQDGVEIFNNFEKWYS